MMKLGLATAAAGALPRAVLAQDADIDLIWPPIGIGARASRGVGVHRAFGFGRHGSSIRLR
jgi:hypothetical protein